MTEPTAIMLVGLPGSGKSTYANQPTLEKFRGATRISTDDFIEQYAASVGKTYGEVFKEQIGPATTWMSLQLAEALAQKNDIVWDQTNLTVKSRKPKIEKLKKAGYEVIAIAFEPTEEELLARQEKRLKETGKFIAPYIIASMRASYERPTTDEGFLLVLDYDK